jgi:hypothetical protein
MKRIILAIAVFGMFGILTTSVMAGGFSANIVQVSHPHYGGHHGGNYGGWYGPRAYYPPVYVRHSYMARYAPPPPIYYRPPVYRSYYYPRSNFYYASPGFSIGVGF